MSVAEVVLRIDDVGVGIMPSNYYCMLETLIVYIDISFYI